MRVRVRPPGASTAYVFQFKNDRTGFVNIKEIEAPKAEAGVLVGTTTFKQEAWPGVWEVRVRVNGGGDITASSPDYPWTDWRPCELR